MADSSVKFDENGDGIPRYTIYNYQKNYDYDDNTDYNVIGKWHSQLMMDAKDVIWSDSEAMTSTTTSTVSAASYQTLSYEDLESEMTTTMSPMTTISNAQQLWDQDQIGDANAIPQSVCSFPCKTGEIMIMNTVTFQNTSISVVPTRVVSSSSSARKLS